MTIPLQHRPHHLLIASTTHQTIQNPHHIQNAHVESDPLQAINNFKKLLIQHKGFTKFDLPPALKACSKASALSPGKQIHALSIKCCLSTDIYTQTSLLSMYSACGELDAAMRLFEKMPERNVVSWTAMIKAFLHCDQPEMALAAFREMQMAGVKLDDFTVVNVLSACARLGMLNLGRWVHAYVSRGCFILSVFIGTALVDMYCKCGSIGDALAVFNSIEKKNVQTWNAMLHGLSIHGYGLEVIQLFEKMETDGEVSPNEVTFVAVLCGCSHSGLPEEGQFYFNVMQKKYRIEPTVKHYGCMVDLLARTGRLDEAFKLVTEMQIPPNVVVLGALLSACRIQNNVFMAERVMEKINRMEKDCPHSDTSHYVIMSNVYSQAGLKEKMAEVRMKVGKKPTGSSWIEIGCDVHEFAVGRTSHPMWEKIQQMLVEVTAKLGRKSGREEDLQSSHSEMVAVAFGLLMTSASMPIRIAKNLRICEDCHDAMKSISEAYGRVVIVRDCTRFHQFRAGHCSCNDYW
ncbi:hypothetical protein MRB53_019830 [Persea americana]|uniref:Uncharacterized protein n=1 Tax=Persea americana TaxID=3435 RepID=A0ACC2KZG3_PERAE|nr:hypothetical protein MRB53_019830 [Persea americana]